MSRRWRATISTELTVATEAVRRMMLEGIACNLLAEATVDCCGDVRWRKRLCPVHAGWEDGMQALIDKMLADTAQIDGRDAP